MTASSGSGDAGARIRVVFGLLVVAMIVLQKFGFTEGAGSVGLDTGLLWLGLGWLALHGELRIVRHRLVLLVLLLDAIALNLVLAERPVKWTALGIVLVLYVGFIFQARLADDTVSKCLDKFQRCMAVIAAIVIGQQLVQYTIGNRFWPDLDRMFPASLLYPGFAYIHPYSWRSRFLEPNGVVFLEPSALSYYLAAAFVLEVVRFRRLVLLGLFTVAILACLAGTGPTALLLTAPAWAPKLGRRLAVPLFAVGLPLLLVVSAAGWLAPLTNRSTELSNDRSSGYARIVEPLETIAGTIREPGIVFEGHGPGSSAKSPDAVQWPFSKLLYEYGLATAVLFHVFLLVSVLDAPPSRTLAIFLLVPYLFFGGGFVSHASVMPLLLLCSLLAGRRRELSGARPARAGDPVRRVASSPRTSGGPRPAEAGGSGPAPTSARPVPPRVLRRRSRAAD